MKYVEKILPSYNFQRYRDKLYWSNGYKNMLMPEIECRMGTFQRNELSSTYYYYIPVFLDHNKANPVSENKYLKQHSY